VGKINMDEIEFGRILYSKYPTLPSFEQTDFTIMDHYSVSYLIFSYMDDKGDGSLVIQVSPDGAKILTNWDTYDDYKIIDSMVDFYVVGQFGMSIDEVEWSDNTAYIPFKEFAGNIND